MKPEIKTCLAQIRAGEIPQGYKNTPIGILKSDWSNAKLYEIAEILTETAGKNQYETLSISAGIGFVNQAKKFGKELSGKQYEKYIVLRKGDFSYNKGNSKSYPQGCIYRLNDREEAAVPNVFESFRIAKGCPEYYEQLFIAGFLNSQLYRFINHGVRDDGLLNLTERDFYSCIVPVPPLEEQKKIADILSAQDKIIELCERKLEQLKRMKKYYLQKMFPKDGEEYPEIRFKGFTDAWEQRKLESVIEDYAEKTTVENQYPVLTSSQQKGIVLQDDYFAGDRVSQSGNIGYFIIPRGYFTYRSRSDNDVFVFNRNDCVDTGIISYFYPVFKPKNADSNFLLRRLNNGLETQLKIASEGTGQHVLSLKKFKNMVALFPSISEQQHIGAFYESLDNLITLHQRKCEEEKKKKKALQQLLLTGIVRVKK